MKNRRLALVAFLLCACMIVGVGYAAVVTSLNVDGKVSFDSQAAVNYAAQIHFTGNTEVLGPNHSTLEANDAVIAVVQSGEQTATVSANFNSANITQYKVGDVYVADIVLEVEVVLPTGASEMVVTFGDDPQVSGNVGNGTTSTNANFIVNSYLYEDDNPVEVEKVTVSTTTATSEKLELHVRIEVPAAIVTAGNDVDEVAFQVILPVTDVEITPAA